MPQRSATIRSGRPLALVTNFIAGVGLMAYLGYQLDKKFATPYYFWTLGGMTLGLAWAFYELIKFVRSAAAAEDSARDSITSPKNNK